MTGLAAFRTDMTRIIAVERAWVCLHVAFLVTGPGGARTERMNAGRISGGVWVSYTTWTPIWADHLAQLRAAVATCSSAKRYDVIYA
ncbi:MAG: hypothetical protein KBG15_06205 [Kofleriaceae bacterium]|nr:hypothetical protein [Kofleriaceae bacterium]